MLTKEQYPISWQNISKINFQNFPKWNVDCEYNRVKYDFKKVNGKLVNPDIIVHHRNTFVNLLVVEVKKSGNKKGIK